MATQSTVPLGLVIVVAIIVVWILHKLATAAKEAIGSVELGVGTVDGEFGRDVYYSRRSPSIELDPSNPAVDERMRELIFESNRQIAADDAAEGSS
jgi:hypothetical protein